MTRSLGFTLSTVVGLARLVTITRRDGTIIRLTDAYRDVVIGADTWQSDPIEVSDMEFTADGSMSNATIRVLTYVGGTVDIADVVADKYSAATCRVYLCDPFDDTPVAGIVLDGLIGDAKFDLLRRVSFEVRSRLQLGREFAAGKYGPLCRHDLGSQPGRGGGFCGVPVMPDDLARSTTYAVGAFTRWRFGSAGDPSDYANKILEATAITTGITPAGAPTPNATIGGTYVDGGVTWTTRNSWTRYAQIGVVNNYDVSMAVYIEPRSVDGWNKLGQLIIRSGEYDGYPVEIVEWFSSASLALTVEKISDMVETGDWVEVIPGCDKFKETCATKFVNVQPNGGLRFGGEITAPGAGLPQDQPPPIIVGDPGGMPGGIPIGGVGPGYVIR